MPIVRVALANLRFPASPDAAVSAAAAAGSPSSAIAGPDGALLAYQPYGVEGLLVADLDLSAATGRLASRYKAI